MDLFTNHSKPCSIGQKHSHCLTNYSNSVVIGYPESQTTAETTDNRYTGKRLPEGRFVCSCFDDSVEFIVDLLQKKMNYGSRRSRLSKGGLFSVRYWLGFQGNQVIVGLGQTQVHRECMETRWVIWLPLVSGMSNSNHHFVWSWLKRFPWLANISMVHFVYRVFSLESSVGEIRIN